jgi:hypothetical protein
VKQETGVGVGEAEELPGDSKDLGDLDKEKS